MKTGTPSRPNSPASAQRSSIDSSMASPTKTSACTFWFSFSLARMRQHFADLGMAAAAVDLRHQCRQLVAHPTTQGEARHSLRPRKYTS